MLDGRQIQICCLSSLAGNGISRAWGDILTTPSQVMSGKVKEPHGPHYTFYSQERKGQKGYFRLLFFLLPVFY